MVVDVVTIILTCYMIMISFYIIGSWFNKTRGSRVYNLISRIVEPPLSLMRRVVPRVRGVDITPSLLIFILYAIVKVIK